MKILTSLLSLTCFFWSLHAEEAKQHNLNLKLDQDAQTIAVYREGDETAYIVQNAKKGFRPYLHPIVAPDGKGVLTQFSPKHHKHQTGVYWGFSGVNERSFFHNPNEKFWKRKSMEILEAKGHKVKWKVVYDMLAEDGSSIMEDSQVWTVSDQGDHFFMDLEWTGKALVELTVKEYTYGGFFIRMPYLRGTTKAAAINAEEKNKGLSIKSSWVNVGMEIADRDDWGNIALFDHPQNANYPNYWRVDGHMGFGPASTKGGSWSLKKGQSRTYKHRLVVYCGDFNKGLVDQAWSQWSEASSKTVK